MPVTVDAVEMLTIDPVPASRIAGTTAAIALNAPCTLTAKQRCQSSASVASISPTGPAKPALLTSTSTGPTSATSWATDARSATSELIAIRPAARAFHADKAAANALRDALRVACPGRALAAAAARNRDDPLARLRSDPYRGG